MIPRIDNKMFTNVMLSVIALTLVVIATQKSGVGVESRAEAQSALIDKNIPQTQDIAVAAATMQVAESNREIATAIRELAKAVGSAGSARATAATSGAAASDGSAASTAPAQATERPTIQVID